MAGYRSIPVIVRPSDLRARTVPSHVAQAVRDGRARFVGFEGQGEPVRRLSARETTKALARGDFRGLAERAVRMVVADEVDADACAPGDRRGGGVTGPSRRGA